MSVLFRISFFLKTTFLITVVLFSVSLYGQSSTTAVQLPEVLPASPEPTAFVKAGVGNANLSTGAANANIPLYTIALKNFSLPISLSYTTQGLKVDEATTRVGFGWVLNAAPMITRSVRGAPDEFSGRMPVPADFTATTDELFTYYYNAGTTGSGYDTQPDEFQFSCNGYSGKFILDDNFVPRMTSASNVKVTIAMTPGSGGSSSGMIGIITLVTPDGAKYQFGDTYEIATDFSTARYSPYKGIVKTSFFLDRIDLPSGESVVCNYLPLNTQYSTGISQALQKATIEGLAICGDCNSFNSYTTQYDHISYKTNYLSSITTSNQVTLSFSYENRPDGTNDNRLIELEIIGANTPLKKYQFDYYDVPTNSSTATGRFFLTKVSDVDVVTGESHDYELGYNRLDDVPLPINFNQDYLGFYNGTTSHELIPPAANSSGVMDFSFRDPSAGFSIIGTLSSILYPTGGKEEFFYESNTTKSIVKSDDDLVIIGFNSKPGGGGNNSSTEIAYTLPDITVPKDQTVTFHLSAEDADETDLYTAESETSHKTVLATLIDEDGNKVVDRSITSFGEYETDITLTTGHTYTLTMKVEAYYILGSCSFTIDNTVETVYDTLNVAIPGVRLKQIRFTDPYSTNTHSKYYTYATYKHTNISTGAASWTGFVSGSDTRIGCQNQEFTACHLNVYSSNSTNALYSYAGSGSVIYYTSVIESDSPDLRNGGTQYNFFENENGDNYVAVLGSADVGELPGGQHPTLSGQVESKIIFDGNKKVVQQEVNNYSLSIDASHLTVSIYVRKRYDPNTPEASRFLAFDVVRSDYRNYWYRLTSTTVTIPGEEKNLIQTTSYSYSSSNILPTETITTDSELKTVKTIKAYPNTSPLEGDDGSTHSTANYDLLVWQNRLNEVVGEQLYRGDKLVFQRKVYYKDWFDNNKIVEPEWIEVKQSDTDVVHDAIQYKHYTTQGNPEQVQKVNDVSLVYLWDEVIKSPICEVKNAEYGQVAYTGFENNANGNWQLDGTLNTNTFFTGSTSFTGTLQKSISLSGSYKVSAWSTQQPTVNNIGGTLAATSGGWNLYTWQLTNPSQITVTGTEIDEVRLMPSNAQMQTFTYRPFVGITEQVDGNNQVTHYEYDTFNRLQVVKDHQKNIVKTIKYHYQGEQ